MANHVPTDTIEEVVAVMKCLRVSIMRRCGMESSTAFDAAPQSILRAKGTKAN